MEDEDEVDDPSWTVDHLLRWRDIGAPAVDRGAQIVDDDFRPGFRQLQRMLAPDPARRAGNDGNPSFT